MKFEAPKMEVKMFNVEDILTTSGGDSGEVVGVADGVGSEGGTCNGTMADYWQDNCPAY